MTDGRDTARWTDEEMRAYLLDTLGADRKAALEEQIFDDEHAYEALLDARYDLLDDYARDVLSPPERGQVERRLLDAAGESALGLADLLARRQPLPALQVAHDRPSRRGGQRLLVLAAAAALVMAVGVATWLALDNRRLRADLARVTAVPPVVPRPAAADGLVARLELTPRTTRSAAAPEFTIAPAAAVVEVVVPVDEIAPDDPRDARRAQRCAVDWTRHHACDRRRATRLARRRTTAGRRLRAARARRPRRRRAAHRGGAISNSPLIRIAEVCAGRDLRLTYGRPRSRA